MKVIIAGSRSIVDPLQVMEAWQASPWFPPVATEVVSGGASGVDHLGERCAESLNVPVKRFLAKWNKYGKGAGFVRNQQMGSYADALIAIWDGKSNGTRHMIQWMERLKKPTFVRIVSE